MAHRFYAAVVFVLFSVSTLDAQFLASFQTKPLILNTTSLPSANGQLPAGIAVVTEGSDSLSSGDVLVSNWASSTGVGGTGNTIVKITPKGEASNWATIDWVPQGCGSGIGLTPAICTLPNGIVAVGSIPVLPDGNYSTSEPGCILLLNSTGNVVDRIAGNMINGPWRMACDQVDDTVYMFVATGLRESYQSSKGDNIYEGDFGWAAWNKEQLNQSGSVVKLTGKMIDGIPRISSQGYIAYNTFYTNYQDKFLGPGGMTIIDRNLYIVDPFSNSLWVSFGATAGKDVINAPTLVCSSKRPSGSPCSGFDVPVDVTSGPNSEILIVNYGNSTIVEVANGAVRGQQRAVKYMDVADGSGPWGQFMGIANARSNSTYIAGFKSSQVFMLQPPASKSFSSNFAGRKL